jgi:hypothetical protein
MLVNDTYTRANKWLFSDCQHHHHQLMFYSRFTSNYGFRRTGELFDITVIVDKTESELHTYGVFIKLRRFENFLIQRKIYDL